ncbi:MAG: Hpt domain-containing protein [Pirellulales bacterium]
MSADATTRRTIVHFIQQPASSTTNGSGSPVPSPHMERRDVIDYRGTLERFGFDTELFREMVALFREDLPPRLQRLLDAARADDVTIVAFEAHALKGMAASFDARRAVAAAMAVELPGRIERRLPDEAALVELHDAFREVLATFDGYAATGHLHSLNYATNDATLDPGASQRTSAAS